MAAASIGNGALCQHLLEAGSPWNAVDRQGQCAGNYATDNQHWGVVNLLVDWGVRAELILGMIERSRRDDSETKNDANDDDDGDAAFEDADAKKSEAQPSGTQPVEHEPSTKPDYLRQRLHYSADGNALLDSDEDAVMMEWERPLMEAHAQILMEGTGRRVMNVGFGMGIIDTALQNMQPSQHIIIEAHPDVYKRMLVDKWDQKPNVRICFGRWQDEIPKLIAEGVVVDAIFYDTVRGR
jgi:protein arginine N-methyltransferase 2